MTPLPKNEDERLREISTIMNQAFFTPGDHAANVRDGAERILALLLSDKAALEAERDEGRKDQGSSSAAEQVARASTLPLGQAQHSAGQWRPVEGKRQPDPAGFVALVQANPGFWCADFAVKYLNITIDTRDPAVFWLADRDNNPIHPQRVLDAIAHPLFSGTPPISPSEASAATSVVDEPKDDDWKSKYLSAEARATTSEAERDGLRAAVEAAKSLVAMWRAQKVPGLSRTERNEAIEGMREQLVTAVDALAALTNAKGQP